VESRNILSFYQSIIQNWLNMKYKINLFGITRDIVGGNVTEIELGQLADVQAVLGKLKTEFPKLKEIKSLLVAVNSEYAEADLVLNETDEIALIPPVSGG
jgi:molybdopterin converting factor subunit 1